MKIQLSKETSQKLLRPVKGSGGFQSLLRRLQESLDKETDVLNICESDMEKYFRYTSDYGQGGFQDRLRSSR